jgi:Xaa-Pro aminopeptidase
MNTRLERVRAAMRERDMPALLVSQATNRRYISGFSGSAGVLLIAADAALLFTDFRYRTAAAQAAPDFELREVGGDTPLPGALASAVAELGLRQFAFEARHLSVARFHEFQQAIAESEAEHKAELLPTEGLVEPLREAKDEAELATLRQAITITDAALAAVLPLLTPQHTEAQAAWMLEAAMRERGAEGVSFPIIVAAGRNAALPHATPGEQPLGEGQPIVIDMGARYQGYHADLTRTVVLGTPDDQFMTIYRLVLEAQQQAIAQIRPGLKGSEADALARDLLDAAGYGKAFGHSLGHGVGLEIHEGPSLGRTGERELQPGSVFSVEPGIYLEEWGGVRIEDLVLLDEQGCTVLSQSPKEPLLRAG